MERYENICNNCEDCINCGRNRRIRQILCDECEEILHDKYYDLENNQILCEQCATEYIVENIDDFLKEYEYEVD